MDHVVPRSQAPHRLLDKTNLVTLCRRCHNRKKWPAEQGRLVVEALGDEQFAFSLTFTPKYPRR